MNTRCFACKQLFEHWVWNTYYCGMCEYTKRANESRRAQKLRTADELRGVEIEKRYS